MVRKPLERDDKISVAVILGYTLVTTLVLTVGYFAGISELITIGYNLSIFGVTVPLVAVLVVGRYRKRSR